MIEAINEQLLRAIGVGVALVDVTTGAVRFANDTFSEWFGADRGDGAVIVGTLDVMAALEKLRTEGRHTVEVTFKSGRRSMTVAIEFNRALEEQNLAVLVCQNISRIKELESMIDSYAMMVERNTHEIRREKEQVEKLLLNLMPRSAYEEFRSFGAVVPRTFDSVSVISVDFQGFADLLAANDPASVVADLNDIFTAFDRIGQQFGCERIRTMGDSYIAVAGVPDPVGDHAAAIAGTAVRFLRFIRRRNETHQMKWPIRIGIASGSVIGSVVGVQKYVYDVFGPAVTTANKVRRSAETMTVATDLSTAALLGEGFAVIDKGDGLRILQSATE
ncbi:adenylate/guanylate cyclase domain-containing protein [Silicimonas algicola]|uniref:Class 3 adenylate cyclase n=1 Tax=Silicimonas algicola TaxID=1826607 RepID=A0A316GFN8_9RHOB|nr:adenylate/guanylate cyclase domain-containing protein [Silicimonas algicola]AZQ68407.1 adenylate/guanylate cyclase domain-containing protein [Silicimonas algicola]PWK53507.1 class 3 adenylate cyclase [Silicimonas algicola]